MRKKLILLFIFLLALASFAGYIFLTEQITVGTAKIANGEKQLAEGEQMLANGKARLAEGKRKMAPVNVIQRGLDAIPFMNIAKKMPISDDVLAIANQKINEGNQMIANGQEKIKSGEKQLAEGKLQLKKGLERLSHAHGIQTLCLMGAISFTLLLIFLGFLWRKSLIVRRGKCYKEVKC